MRSTCESERFRDIIARIADTRRTAGELENGTRGIVMTNGIVGLVIGLLLGAYLTASYSDHVVKDFQKVGIPLMGQHATVSSP
jgi:hypothetical protein